MAIELYANQPSTTVTSGGTDAPASGTQETWTVASSAGFPAASTSSSPPGQFHVADASTAALSELVAVTAVSGTTWTVTRGAEGTTPVAHTAGFVIYQVASAGALQALGGVTVKVPVPAGATATDTPNVVAAITSLVAALAHGPATLEFQDGTYQIDSNTAVIQSVSNFAVRTSGGTVITQAPNTGSKPNNTTGDLLVIANCTDFRVENLTLDGLRDTVAPMTPLTAAASSGQPAVTVAAGQGANYKTGQNLLLFGGLGTAEQNLSDGYAAGAGVPLVVLSIAAGGGSGGGDLITFTTNLGNSYTDLSNTSFSDGFGPYAYAGAYLTPYQAANGNSVAGRTLSGEDQQCGLHLISCARFTVTRVTGRNVWESPLKLGTGFATTSLTDGCQQGTVTDCTGYHAYDQGISVWVSKDITVKGCVANAAGWAGISLTESDDCTVTGNQLLNSVYRVPNDTSSGYGLAIEGGLHNQVRGNVITSPYEDGIWLRTSPLGWGLYASNSCQLSSFLAAQTAAGTSIQFSSTTNVQPGGRYSLVDGTRTEALTCASVVDGTHLTFSEAIMFSHASGTCLMQRIGQENVIDGNTIYGAQFRDGVHLSQCVRQQITGNVIRNWGLGAGSTGSGIVFDYSTTNLTAGVFLGGDGSSIDGNVIAGGLGNGVVAAASATENLSGLKIRGNDIFGLMAAANTAAINLKNVTDSIVQGNKVTDLESAVGIWVQNTNSGTAPARVTITGNRVRRCFSAGILMQTCDSLTVSGNSVSSCGGHSGINGQGLSRSVISDNVSNSNQNGGIKLEDNSSVFCLYNRVTGNTCREDGSGINVTTGNAWTQPHGIVEAGTSNDNLFMGNECDANTSDQLTTVGGGSVTHYNILSGTISS